MRSAGVVVVLLAVIGCGSDDAARICESGSARVCSCPSGEQGTQDCLANGIGFAQCECGGSVGAGGAGGTGPGPGDPQWSLTVGALDTQRATAVTSDLDGSIVVAGHFAETLSFGGDVYEANGPGDAFVVRYGATGEFVFSSVYGDAQDQYVHALTLSPTGNVSVVGAYNGALDFGGGNLVSNGHVDMYATTLAADGSHIWSSHYGGLYFDEATTVTSDANGNVYIAGFFMDSVDFGLTTLVSEDGLDAFVLKFGPSGAPLWVAALTGPGDQQAFGVAADDDHVWLAGRFDGELTVASETLLPSDGFDGFMVQLTSEGTLASATAFGGAGDETINGIALNSEGPAIAGTFDQAISIGAMSLQSSGGTDGYVAQLDASGAPLWATAVGDIQDQTVDALTVADNGDVLVAGAFEGTLETTVSRGQSDAFAMRFDSLGALRWSKGFGGTEADAATDISVDPDGYVAVVGYFRDTITLFDDHVSLGDEDLFVTRLLP